MSTKGLQVCMGKNTRAWKTAKWLRQSCLSCRYRTFGTESTAAHSACFLQGESAPSCLLRILWSLHASYLWTSVHLSEFKEQLNASTTASQRTTVTVIKEEDFDCERENKRLFERNKLIAKHCSIERNNMRRDHEWSCTARKGRF